MMNVIQLRDGFGIDRLSASEQLKPNPGMGKVLVRMDVVVETVGGQNLPRSLDAVRMGGHISIVGLLDGFEIRINALTLLHQQVTLHGMEVGSTQDFVAMNEAIETHDIHPIIDKTFPLEQTQSAFEYLERGLHFGKVVISH